MFGNGAAIGMVNIIAVMRKPILRDLYQAFTACFVAAVGPTVQSVRALRIVTGPPAFAVAPLASALPVVQNRFVKVSRPRIAKSEMRDKRNERQCARCY